MIIEKNIQYSSSDFQKRTIQAQKEGNQQVNAKALFTCPLSTSFYSYTISGWFFSILYNSHKFYIVHNVYYLTDSIFAIKRRKQHHKFLQMVLLLILLLNLRRSGMWRHGRVPQWIYNRLLLHTTVFQWPPSFFPGQLSSNDIIISFRFSEIQFVLCAISSV